MNEHTDLAKSIWKFLDYPFIKLGDSSITIWAITLNLLLILIFVGLVSKIKNFLLASVSKEKGINTSNWRATITLVYYGLLILGLIGILQASGLDLSIFAVLTGAIGIGVGFGMQTIFSNFVSGIIRCKFFSS